MRGYSSALASRYVRRLRRISGNTERKENMMNEYLAKQADCLQGTSTLQLSLHQLAATRLENAKNEVARLEELAALLERNPEISRVLELLGSRGLL